ncbi:type II toxin-antitoxin system RelE/ParE family toxin [Pseudomonas mohnii]|uniref:type II toxin-antitoxin system RelE/ParE family toxin n=1 Tax=unclassified Pseudomonas TaxID=196821 RepID=UPI00102A0E4A|nr:MULTISPECIES: type II toxin-antitoxin system RelE/ParE family toxin [unclassified Pseudomonas]MBM6444293.1 type II toxin-antitoxin system RelE/ParE family toxin [Pseudomonas sp. MIL9]RZO02379.1 type II toxin-antitoxin system RelE/ParE family toxin [Pseudomonas moorei]
MRIIWTREAAQDRADIWDYLYAINPKAAIDMDNRFSDAISRLAQHPESGPAGIIAGTRELIPHQSYRIVYEQAVNAIWILALVHTSRQWPPEN